MEDIRRASMAVHMLRAGWTSLKCVADAVAILGSRTFSVLIKPACDPQ